MSRESVQSLAAKRVRRQKIFIAVGSVACSRSSASSCRR